MIDYPADLLAKDLGRSPDQLDDDYNQSGFGEHPMFPREAWQEAVANEDTLLGYWQWLYHQIQEQEQEADQ